MKSIENKEITENDNKIKDINDIINMTFSVEDNIDKEKQEDENEKVEMLKIKCKANFIDVMTWERIENPVRFKKCEHYLQCVNYSTMELYNEKRVDYKWECPICKTKGRKDELIIDEELKLLANKYKNKPYIVFEKIFQEKNKKNE